MGLAGKLRHIVEQRRALKSGGPPLPLQVSGDAFLQCLKMALDAAPNMHQALQVRTDGRLLLLSASAIRQGHHAR